MFYFYSPSNLKTTSGVDFTKAQYNTKNRKITNLLNQVTAKRKSLLLLLSKSTTTEDQLQTALDDYLSFFQGFLSLQNVGINYRWGNTIGIENTESDSANFEMNSMLLNFTLWQSKNHISKVLHLSVEYEMAQVTQLFRKLKTIAGILYFVHNSSGLETKTNKIPTDSTPQDPNAKPDAKPDPKPEPEPKPETAKPTKILTGDLHSDIVHALYLQAIAQAQEVTIQIGVHRRSPPEYLSKVSNDISCKYMEAAKLVSKARQLRCEKLFSYLKFKADGFKAYAYCFNGAFLLSKDECGEAVASYKQASLFVDRAKLTAKDHDKYCTENHFFHALSQFVKIGRTKVESENSMIYRKKVPEKAPDLPSPQQAFQLDPAYVLPNICEHWTTDILKSFHI